MIYSNSRLFLYSILSNVVFACNCNLPEGCKMTRIYDTIIRYNYNEKGLKEKPMILCDIKNDDENSSFRFKDSNMDNYYNKTEYVILKWQSIISSSILDERFNFSNAVRYLNLFSSQEVNLKLWGIKGFDVNFIDDSYSNRKEQFEVELSNCKLDFYHHRKKNRINSCRDLIDTNITRIRSLFQIDSSTNGSIHIHLRNVEFKFNLCPLVFQNTNIRTLLLNDLLDTFYKRNVFSLSNETLPKLNSTIISLELHNLHSINLDSNLLNPSVFKKLTTISILSGSLNSIDQEIFKHLNSLQSIYLSSIVFRKINHKQGINWIKQINFDVNVNLSGKAIDFKLAKYICLLKSFTNPNCRVTKTFPEEDFCIYIGFPFNQLVIIYEVNLLTFYTENEFYFKIIKKEYTCTYLWLIKHYEYYSDYYFNINKERDVNIIEILNSTAFKSISNCNFEERISRCNKSKYQTKEIWDESDFFILNKKIQIAFKISLYPISLLGLITNFIVVLVILKKDNSDLFKDCKQYNYLYINSIFCMMISVIEILSWMTECFYPFEVFCPEIRKLVAIQFLKIIFKECFVTVFRFMCNFTYIAFALNRISLIGKDHGKIVTFMSEAGIKKYIGITLFISLLLSWVKYFKFEVNYFYPNSNFPMSNELNIAQGESNSFNDVYFIFNAISDLVNYLVFVVICVMIDIFMVLKLRRVLAVKSKKGGKSMSQNQEQTKNVEFEEAVNKAIKMVVLNSLIGIFFKLPVSFIPLLNVLAEFYYKNIGDKYLFIYFIEFYSVLLDSGFYPLIQDLSHFFFNLSLSIQMFVYYRFDKKFRTGFGRLLE